MQGSILFFILCLGLWLSAVYQLYLINSQPEKWEQMVKRSSLYPKQERELIAFFSTLAIVLLLPCLGCYLFFVPS